MILLAYSYHIPIISNISENEQIVITKTTIDLAAASNSWFVLYQWLKLYIYMYIYMCVILWYNVIDGIDGIDGTYNM
jgi:hypothetical protein